MRSLPARVPQGLPAKPQRLVPPKLVSPRAPTRGSPSDPWPRILASWLAEHSSGELPAWALGPRSPRRVEHSHRLSWEQDATGGGGGHWESRDTPRRRPCGPSWPGCASAAEQAPVPLGEALPPVPWGRPQRACTPGAMSCQRTRFWNRQGSRATRSPQEWPL